MIKNKFILILAAASIFCTFTATSQKTEMVNGQYKIVDTGQSKFFNNSSEIDKTEKGDPFYGQDAQFSGNQASYTDNGDGTITDNVSGLIWQKEFEVLTYTEALERVKTFKLAKRSDWRIPNIKEAYSLILFNGIDVSNKDMDKLPKKAKPFIDTNYFDFEYGSNGNRVIDVQLLSSTVYKGKTMNGMKTVFGVNLADGRIKGYPTEGPKREKGENQNHPPKTQKKQDSKSKMSEKENPSMEMGGKKYYTVHFVCGNSEYGKNIFADNENGTISDLATNLMWDKNDSKQGMNWSEALAWAQQKNDENYLGYNDWRVPNAKELQSILDYSRSLQSTNSAAINELFSTSQITDEGNKNNYPFYWTSTTHEGQRGGSAAVYISFGEALGFMKFPWSDKANLLDVHGAGAQRSDPKEGNAEMFPQGRGPQGDVIRINNYIRLVRDI